MVVVAGALAAGFAVYVRRQNAVTEELKGKLGAALKAAEKAREEESQRIAADFHDGPLQSFISLQMRLEILRKLLERDTDAGMHDLKELQALAQSQAVSYTHLDVYKRQCEMCQRGVPVEKVWI